jgi:hypothetical protein
MRRSFLDTNLRRYFLQVSIATLALFAALLAEQIIAGGAALAVVAHGFSWDLIAFLAVAVLILVGMQRILRSWLIDLY